jgi:hypothetical protein
LAPAPRPHVFARDSVLYGEELRNDRRTEAFGIALALPDPAERPC